MQTRTTSTPRWTGSSARAPSRPNSPRATSDRLSLVLYDLTSSYFEDAACPLARIGYSRDGKKGKPQVDYGLLSDARGCPVAVSVHEGNTADPTTLTPEVCRLREGFGINNLVMVGDRCMISQQAIAEVRIHDTIG